MIMYGSEARTVLHLNSHSDKKSLLDAVGIMPQLYASERTARNAEKALNMARKHEFKLVKRTPNVQ